MKLPSLFKHNSLCDLRLSVMTIIIFAAGASGGWAKDQLPFGAAKIIFELNSTAHDLGIQVSLDGEPWRKIKVVDPKGRTMVEIQTKGRLKKFGLTELFAESNEPNFADMSQEDILALFPEGEYKFFGKTVGMATLTHGLPDGPVINSAIGGVVDPNNAVVSWTAVITPAGINIVGYQVIVEGGGPFRTFDAILPAATQVTVPPEFFEPGTEYNFEVLAIEESGNQIITEGVPFMTP